MKKIFIILFSFLFALEIKTDFGTFIIDDISIEKPFLGGFNKPKIQWIDWDNDDDNDLFVLDEDGLIKYFQNNGSCIDNQNYDCSFSLVTTSFQNINNISWFYLADFDFDDDYDMVTQDPSNLDQLIYYNNDTNLLSVVGTVVEINGNIVSNDPVMTPTFIDIDGDDDLDFFTGNVLGTVTFYENVGYLDNKPIFNFISDFWQEIYIVGSSQRHGASAINFIDLDDDDDFDLAWGDYFQQSLYIVWNVGETDNPIMDINNIVTQFPLNNPVLTAGLNMPSFTDIDNDDDMDLFVTVLSGAYGYQLINNFIFYEKQEEFIYKTSNFIKTIDLLSDVNPAFVDIDNDNDKDLFIGTDFDPSSFPWIGKVLLFENIGLDENQEPIWSFVGDDYFGDDLGNNLSIDFGDIDNDGDFDAFIGNFNGTVKFFENIGTEENFEFNFQEELNEIDLSGYSSPEVFDINNDGDLDLLIGHMSGTIIYYENIGTVNEFNFNLVSENFQEIDVGFRSSISNDDIDNDGDIDLIIGSGYQNIMHYKNNSIDNTFIFEETNQYYFPSLGLNASPEIFKNNSYNGLVVGVSTGGMHYLNIGDYVLGDINNDQAINIYDIVILIEHIINEHIYSENFDLNNDMIVNIIDIIALVDLIFIRM